MANWSHTNSQGWGDISEGWEATINGTRFSIVVDARTGKGTLYRSAPGNAPIKVKDGLVEQLKRYAETLRFSRPGQPERFDRYGYEKMDYDRLMRESFHLKDSAEYAMSLGRKDPELRQKITALQQEFARRGFTAAATVLNAFLRKSFSRPGEKDTMASHKEGFQKEYVLWALPKGETDRLEERPIAEGITTPQQMDDAKRKAAAQGWHGFRVQILDMSKPFRWMSRPGVKDTMAVEDRFYFGKGRKERFADDAKQIADTILKQLGGGRFIAMTGAKNLAFMSNPPGLHMSIGRGAKDGIKYLRVNYDRGSDTYTMIFANKSGGTVKSVSNVYADALRRTFTSITGFDTSL